MRENMRGKKLPQVLVVDDDATIHYLAQESLEKAGFSVATAQNGLEALSAFERINPSIILLDVMMPEMDGFAACKALRNLPGGDVIPILMMTGNDDFFSIERAYETGATDFITKPINWLILGHRIHYMLKARNTLDAFRRSERKNRALLDAIPDLILHVTKEGTILDSKLAREFHDIISCPQLTDRNVTEALPNELAQRIISNIGKAIVTNEMQTFEFPLAENGRRQYLESRIVVSGQQEAITIIQDVTLRKKADEALRESEQKYRALFEDSRDAIYITARDNRFLDLNQSALDLLGYSKDEILGAHFSEVAVDLDRLAGLQEQIERNGSVRDHENQLRTRDGRIMDCLINATVWRTNGQDIQGFQGIIRDITQLKRHQEELQESMAKLRKAMGAIIQVITATIESKDPYIAGHQRRVADLARAIAQEMSLPDDHVDGVRIAGVIHDLGKISVPAEILSKPGQLTDIEFDLIKCHTQTGYDILKSVEFPWPVAEIILQHHERMDGSGYPRGLKGDEVLPEARIIMVADVVEAMSSHRPYRPMLGLDEALEEISRNKGIAYDADVVDACFRVVRKEGFDFDRW